MFNLLFQLFRGGITKKSFFVLIVVGLLIVAFGIYHKLVPGCEEDCVAEELIESIIEGQVGISLDLSPLSPE